MLYGQPDFYGHKKSVSFTDKKKPFGKIPDSAAYQFTTSPSMGEIPYPSEAQQLQ